MGKHGQQLGSCGPDGPETMAHEHYRPEDEEHRNVDGQDAGFAALPLLGFVDDEHREYGAQEHGCGDHPRGTIAAGQRIAAGCQHEEAEKDRDHHASDNLSNQRPSQAWRDRLPMPLCHGPL